MIKVVIFFLILFAIFFIIGCIYEGIYFSVTKIKEVKKNNSLKKEQNRKVKVFDNNSGHTKETKALELVNTPLQSQIDIEWSIGDFEEQYGKLQIIKEYNTDIGAEVIKDFYVYINGKFTLIKIPKMTVPMMPSGWDYLRMHLNKFKILKLKDNTFVFAFY